MYAQEMKLPEGKQCAAFISVNLAAEFFWLSLDKSGRDAQDPVPGTIWYDPRSSQTFKSAGRASY